ncbi:MAG: hypothetical protein H8D35_00140 [Nitrosopumilus sp.]|nr:hypothetical protein [Nitrosopumilus sp.]
MVDIPMDKLTNDENTEFYRMMDKTETTTEKLILNSNDLEYMRADMSFLVKSVESEVDSNKRRFFKRTIKKLSNRGKKQAMKVDRLAVKLCEESIPQNEFLVKLVNEKKIQLDQSLLEHLEDTISSMKSIVEEHR